MIKILRETKKKEENKEKVANFIKETNNELLKLKNNKYLYNNEEKIINQKPFVEDSIFLKGIKKEDTTEIEQIKNKEIENKKDNKENLQLNFINNINEKKYLSKTSRNTNKNKKKIIFNNEHNIDKNEENKSYKSGNQRLYNKEFFPLPNKKNYTELNENQI